MRPKKRVQEELRDIMIVNLVACESPGLKFPEQVYHSPVQNKHGVLLNLSSQSVKTSMESTWSVYGGEQGAK